ncbi:WD repeat-containing protein 60 [Tupaia chinensis]|uniref:WD repeat-containing protein 60 n=1 Tax=Tupaia chinensis TaxID=246437 RepID=L9L418_TUPCH|nr:WD repeat-containing protein 60 [Tupaia chinensis]
MNLNQLTGVRAVPSGAPKEGKRHRERKPPKGLEADLLEYVERRQRDPDQAAQRDGPPAQESPRGERGTQKERKKDTRERDKERLRERHREQDAEKSHSRGKDREKDKERRARTEELRQTTAYHNLLGWEARAQFLGSKSRSVSGADQCEGSILQCRWCQQSLRGAAARSLRSGGPRKERGAAVRAVCVSHGPRLEVAVRRHPGRPAAVLSPEEGVGRHHRPREPRGESRRREKSGARARREQHPGEESAISGREGEDRPGGRRHAEGLHGEDERHRGHAGKERPPKAEHRRRGSQPCGGTGPQAVLERIGSGFVPCKPLRDLVTRRPRGIAVNTTGRTVQGGPVHSALRTPSDLTGGRGLAGGLLWAQGGTCITVRLPGVSAQWVHCSPGPATHRTRGGPSHGMCGSRVITATVAGCLTAVGPYRAGCRELVHEPHGLTVPWTCVIVELISVDGVTAVLDRLDVCLLDAVRCPAPRAHSVLARGVTCPFQSSMAYTVHDEGFAHLKDYEDDFEVCDGDNDGSNSEPECRDKMGELPLAQKKEVQEVQRAIDAENERIGGLSLKLFQKQSPVDGERESGTVQTTASHGGLAPHVRTAGPLRVAVLEPQSFTPNPGAEVAVSAAGPARVLSPR